MKMKMDIIYLLKLLLEILSYMSYQILLNKTIINIFGKKNFFLFIL